MKILAPTCSHFGARLSNEILEKMFTEFIHSCDKLCIGGSFSPKFKSGGIKVLSEIDFEIVCSKGAA